MAFLQEKWNTQNLRSLKGWILIFCFAYDLSYPPSLVGLVKNLAAINRLLILYEKTNEAIYMKQAAAKIKSDAPILKSLSMDEAIKADENCNNLLKQCKNDMRTLFDKAKKVRI